MYSPENGKIRTKYVKKGQIVSGEFSNLFGLSFKFVCVYNLLIIELFFAQIHTYIYIIDFSYVAILLIQLAKE